MHEAVRLPADREGEGMRFLRCAGFEQVHGLGKVLFGRLEVIRFELDRGETDQRPREVGVSGAEFLACCIEQRLVVVESLSFFAAGAVRDGLARSGA